VRDFYLDSYCWRRGATHEGRPAADALVGKAPSKSDNYGRLKPTNASAICSLALLLPLPECRQTKASLIYSCSGISRITPIAPNSSAASLAAR
jgi:hypothetical protein